MQSSHTGGTRLCEARSMNGTFLLFGVPWRRARVRRDVKFNQNASLSKSNVMEKLERTVQVHEVGGSVNEDGAVALIERIIRAWDSCDGR